MGFLDNSGDIILDAVLTDAGRARLAKGDGSFRITKFALGDDEINYGLYNIGAGTATADVNILMTPVFEAFTNNISSLNSRLITIPRNNLLYLPVIKVNNDVSPSNNYADNSIVQNGYIVAVDKDTENLLTGSKAVGALYGYSLEGGSFIRLDQGIDNAEYSIPSGLETDLDLVETQYLLEMDNRFMSLINTDKNALNTSYIDDDNIAAYYVSRGDPSLTVTDIGNNPDISSVIKGARGTKLQFKLKSSLELSTSDYLFNKMGYDMPGLFPGNTVKKIVTSVRVTGLTTGYALDVPIALVKKIS